MTVGLVGFECSSESIDIGALLPELRLPWFRVIHDAFLYCELKSCEQRSVQKDRADSQFLIQVCPASEPLLRKNGMKHVQLLRQEIARPSLPCGLRRLVSIAVHHRTERHNINQYKPRHQMNI